MADLIDATPSRAILETFSGEVLLQGCTLDGLDLSRLDMAGWRFDRCSLRETKLIGAVLDGAVFTACRGGFADFRAARMSEASLQSCDFNNATFAEAVLTQARIAGCKLVGADLGKAGTTGLILSDSLLCDARLKGVSLRRASLTGVDFTGADLAACDFREAVFDLCSLREANVTGARFDGADLRGADLGGLRLADASKFKGALVSRRQAADLVAQLGLQVI